LNIPRWPQSDFAGLDGYVFQGNFQIIVLNDIFCCAGGNSLGQSKAGVVTGIMLIMACVF